MKLYALWQDYSTPASTPAQLTLTHNLSFLTQKEAQQFNASLKWDAWATARWAGYVAGRDRNLEYLSFLVARVSCPSPHVS